MTSAIKHSLEQTKGLPSDGPPGKTVPSVSGTILEAPSIYYSDGESYASCQEAIDDDEGDDASDIFTDTVDTFDEKSDKNYLSTWLWF